MFQLKTKTKWQKQPTEVVLRDLSEAFSKYPLVERKFFDDLLDLIQKKDHYSADPGLLIVQRSNENDTKQLDKDAWILLWAKDKEERTYQVLIERNPEYKGKGAIAAAGPPSFFEFVSGMKHKMLMPFLGMINTPEKMEKVAIVVSIPKSTTQKGKEREALQALGNFENWIQRLKITPNVEGKWFPGDYPRCPECNNPLVGVQDAKTENLGHLICPFCGYQRSQQIYKGKRPSNFYDLFKR